MASTSTSPEHASNMNKQARAKLAKDTINNVIPHILKSNSQAQTGVQNSELIHYSPAQDARKWTTPSAAADPGDPSSTLSEPSPAPPPSRTPVKVTIIQSDTYDAVRSILKSTHHPHPRIAVLNMASALHPGGGVLRGALAQEESLCMRSTLFPSLRDSFYRIPETAAIYSPDVLVFRSSEKRDVPRDEWFFVDVISCAALKQPDVVVDAGGRVAYGEERDREVMVMKVRLILQVANEKGITHLVLGALGCGAYKNPPEEVARIFKKAIYGDRKRAGVVGIEEIVFAIVDDGENLRVFRQVFRDVICEG